MKRLIPLLLAMVMALSLLGACSSPDAQTTGASPGPDEPSTYPPEETHHMEPDPTHHPEETHHVEPDPTHHPEETHHVEPDPTHHPEETHHVEPDPTHHPEETHHVEPDPTHHPEETHHVTVTPAPTPEPTPTPDAGVDLAAFYEDVTNMHEFGFLGLAVDELLDGYYPGLTGIETEQCLVYVCQMNMNNGEFGLVQVKNSGDVDAVKAIFQARIDYMVGDGNGPGGAWYPMAMDQWENNSRVVSNGNYVMMVIHENCDEIVAQFNELF